MADLQATFAGQTPESLNAYTADTGEQFPDSNGGASSTSVIVSTGLSNPDNPAYNPDNPIANTVLAAGADQRVDLLIRNLPTLPSNYEIGATLRATGNSANRLGYRARYKASGVYELLKYSNGISTEASVGTAAAPIPANGSITSYILSGSAPASLTIRVTAPGGTTTSYGPIVDSSSPIGQAGAVGPYLFNLGGSSTAGLQIAAMRGMAAAGPAGLTVTLGSASLTAGGSTTTATAAGFTGQLAPNSVVPPVFSSSNTAVATVNAATGVVTPVGGGTCNIVATGGLLFTETASASLTVTGVATPIDPTTTQDWLIHGIAAGHTVTYNVVTINTDGSSTTGSTQTAHDNADGTYRALIPASGTGEILVYDNGTFVNRYSFNPSSMVTVSPTSGTLNAAVNTAVQAAFASLALPATAAALSTGDEANISSIPAIKSELDTLTATLATMTANLATLAGNISTVVTNTNPLSSSQVMTGVNSIATATAPATVAAIIASPPLLSAIAAAIGALPTTGAAAGTLAGGVATAAAIVIPAVVTPQQLAAVVPTASAIGAAVVVPPAMLSSANVTAIASQVATSVVIPTPPTPQQIAAAIVIPAVVTPQQLAAVIPSASAIGAAITIPSATIPASLTTMIAQIEGQTANIPASLVHLVVDQTTGGVPLAAGVASAIGAAVVVPPVTVGPVTLAANGLDAVMVEPNINLRQAISPILAATTGSVTGQGATGNGPAIVTAPSVGSLPGAQRITATMQNGTRTNVQLTLPT